MKLGKDYFTNVLFGICLLSIIFQLFFNTYATYSVDDFWFAHRIYQYKDGIPYRDFAPYKTVLGYYVLLVPMLFAKSILNGLLITKNTLAFINMVVLFIAANKLTKYFSKTSILISLSLLLTSDIFLSYSTNIRVDLIGYWFGLFAILYLLEGRYTLSGILIGVGFACTQKVIWYMMASNVALFVYWVICNRQYKFIFNFIRFNLATFIVISTYIIFWSLFSSFLTVWDSIFLEAAAMYHLSWYDAARLLFWSNITLYNPLLFLLWPFTLFSLFVSYKHDREFNVRLIIVVFSLTIMACLIPYKQVFPYYMQVTYPVFFILYAAFFNWLFTIFKSKETIIFYLRPYWLWTFLVIYLLFFTYVNVLFNLPLAYLLFCLIPTSIITYLTQYRTLHSSTLYIFRQILYITFIFIGIIYPLSIYAIKLVSINGRYQQATIDAVSELTNDGSDYVAGIELLFNKNQPIPGMRHLMGPAITYLTNPTPELRAVMLPSLYEDPNASVDSVIASFKAAKVKFIVNNYRIHALPNALQMYLSSQYQHFWGSIYMYAPLIDKGQQHIRLKFSGKYIIEAPANSIIKLNNKIYHARSTVTLTADEYDSYSDSTYRLCLQPNVEKKIFIPEFQKDDWIRVIM